MALTQLCSEGFPDDFPFRLVGRVVLLYRFHHQVHDVKQHSEIGAVSKGDGWFPDSTTTGGAVTEGKNECINVQPCNANPHIFVLLCVCLATLKQIFSLIKYILGDWISTYSISMLSSSTKAEKVPTSSSRKMLYLIQYCTSASELHSANVPKVKQNVPL